MSNTALLTSPRRLSGGRVEILPRGRKPTAGQKPLIDEDVRGACENYARLGAPQVARHMLRVLSSAANGSLINGDDNFSRLVKRQICIHSLDSEGHLPEIGLTDWEREVWRIQNRLKHLDSMPEGERQGEYVKLFNNPSVDPAQLHMAQCVRIADMTEFHAPETIAAASTKIPGILPVHSNWQDVTANYAESILKRYRLIADYAGFTPEYRRMRANAMAYLYPEELEGVVNMLRQRLDAIRRTNEAMLIAANKVAERLGINVLVAYDMASASSVYDRISPDTCVLIIRYSKGAAGLLMAEIVKGKPPQVASDQVAETWATHSLAMAYAITEYQYCEGLREAYAEVGSRDVRINDPKDYIANPKPITGYQRAHIHVVSSDGNTVNSEVQVGTLEMHKKADCGAAPHALYKAEEENGGLELRNGELKRFRESQARVISSGG